MFKLKGFIGLVFLLYVAFAIFDLSGDEDMSFILDSLIVPTITLLYILFLSKKNRYFSLFLLCYSLSDLMSLVIALTIKDGTDLLYSIEYYVANSLYILAYVFLSIKIFKSLSFKYVFKYLKIHVLVLLVLSLYVLYVLQIIVQPNVILDFDYYLEFLYNMVTFTLLSAALLNYFYRDNKKALYLFFGTLLIVFSEIIDIAYIYISPIKFLSFISTTLSLCAFFFFFKQAKFLNKLREENSFVILNRDDSSSNDVS